ncbi:MAG: hypothetical protein ACHQ2Z_07705 [Elusimicrobiota bacterium]
MSPGKTRSLRAEFLYLAGGAAVALSANIVFARLLVPNTSYGFLQGALHELRSLKSPVDWILLGDSTSNTSVRPESLCPRLGVTCLNLSTVGDLSLVEEAWLLELYLRRFPPPHRVIMTHAFPAYGISPISDRLEKGFDVGLKDIEDLKPRGFSRFSPQWWRWLGDRVAPCRFMRAELAESLEEIAEDFLPEAKPVPGPPQSPFSWRRSDYEPIAAGNREALEAIAEMAAARGFPVDIVDSPVSDLLLRHPSDVAARGSVKKDLIAFCRRHEGFTFIANLPESYPASMMLRRGSLIHAGHPASVRFSAKLLEYYRAGRR